MHALPGCPPRRLHSSSHAAGLLLWACAGTLPAGASWAQTALVTATAETDPTPSAGDAADDTAIWIHPGDPALSVVIGTDKNAGIAVYDLAGDELHFRPDGEINNVDLRYGFPLGGETVDLAVASDETTATLAVYAVDPVARSLVGVAAGGGIAISIEPYGSCMYRSPLSGRYYAFATSRSGVVEQWELLDDGAGLVSGSLVRAFDVGGQSEGCVADDGTARLYVGEEAVGIWRYGAEPEDGEVRAAVDTTDVGGHLAADVEGLALYTAREGAGYLIASSQGSDAYVLYEREGDNAYVGTFQIGDGAAIDGTSGTDGIEVSNAALGPAFPAGLFVAQDGDNGDENQNFKLVPWPSIAAAYDPALRVDPSFSPRPPVCEDGFDNDGDGKIDFPEDPQCTSAEDDSELVPEPSGWMLALCALAAAALLARAATARRARRTSAPGRG
jgi:3-phytase